MTHKRLLVAIVLLSGCGRTNPHHWVHLTGKLAYPYSEQYQWVDDVTGRSDDCTLTLDATGDWSLFVRGAAYGDFKMLEQAQQKCYEDFRRFL